MQKNKIFKKTSSLFFFLAMIIMSFGIYHLTTADEFDEEEYDECEESDCVWEIRDDAVLEKGVTVLNKSVRIYEGGTLTIKPGAKIEFADSCWGESTQIFVLGGRIVANGTKENPIYISRQGYNHMNTLLYFANDIYDEDGRVSTPESTFSYVKISGGGTSPYDGGGCIDGICPAFQNIFRSFVNTAYADDYGEPALGFKGGKLRLENCQFSDNYGLDVKVDLRVENENQDDSLRIINSNFENNINNIAVVSDIHGSQINSNPNLLDMLVLQNNWYGSPSGPKLSPYDDREGEFLIGASAVGGFSSTRWALFPDGNANVLFLPGIKASYLYKYGSSGEDQLWPPNYFGDDVSELALDENGESLEDVYAKDIIEQLPFIGKNIYKSFAEKLAELKENRDINDYSLFAYDWRRNVENIEVIGEIERLAINSQNKKVTIIAHSNGGLLAKDAMRKLEEMGRADIIDKIIFVGTPQMGTPRAILSLLYGYDEDLALGSLMSRAEARKLVENMPGAYGLLPSEEYLNRLEEPLIDFFSGESIGKGDFEKFQNFLTGKIDGREKPDEDEVEKENILRENLLDQASLTHENLDEWEPPENVKAIQIAGWGLDTISGIKYSQKEKVNCYSADGKLPSCAGSGEYEPIYEPKWTVDGDEVVTAPSALMIPEKDNSVEKYWVDLWSYDDILTTGRNHGDIFEVSDLQEFLDNIIKNKYQSEELPENIKRYHPNPEDYNDAQPRIRMSLYSPLDIHLYDESNNHTGPKEITDENGNKKIIFEEEIPNSYYQQFGERKYVGFSEGEKIRIELEGYADGAYTLKLEEVAFAEAGEEIISHTSFVNLPASKDTSAKLEISEAGLANLSELQVDFDGDEQVDYSVIPVPNGEATLSSDEILPEIIISSPQNKTYPGDTNLEIVFSVSDNISQPENIPTETYLDNEKISTRTIDLSKLIPGKHTLKISAMDEANNKVEKEVEFSVTMNLNIFQNNVERYYQSGLIKTKAEKNKLLAETNLIQNELRLLAIIKHNPFLNKKTRNLLITLIKNEIDRQFDSMIKRIGRDKKNYDLATKNIIIEDLKWIKNNL
ncbi:MAG: hypothetical protein WC678_00695 [Parcubacteria group bacterium]|jgi:hypothetical protein